ncbi:MAG: MSMEG_4193 family putative phosphomutase [Actinobacteria bacterium]|nr:MAG: MSMEG_4193 family putative phosphomutase [Actinomycetota bacterium]
MATTSPRGASRSTRRPSPGATLLVMVRHGTTPTTGKVLPGIAKGLHLADKGRAEAQAVADRLSGLPKVEAIYASPLERARETAAPIARGLNLRVSIDKGLMDCDVGDWTGASLKAVAKRPEWRVVQRWPSGFRFPNGESFTEMQGRIVDTLDRIRQRHLGATVVVVSHADPIKAAVAYSLGTPLDLFQRIFIAPCSVSAVVYGEGGPAVLTVNAVGSLAELRAS